MGRVRGREAAEARCRARHAAVGTHRKRDGWPQRQAMPRAVAQPAGQCVVKGWAKHEMKVLPGAGVIKDRKTISDFTDLDVDDQGGFPVNSPDCMVLDQSINNTWKNLKYGGLNAKFQRRKPSRKTNGGFVNDVYSSWEEMKTGHIRNAIDTQRGVMTRSDN